MGEPRTTKAKIRDYLEQLGGIKMRSSTNKPELLNELYKALQIRAPTQIWVPKAKAKAKAKSAS
jgi:hypothetical protein